MKNFLCWTATVVFLTLGITAFQMHEVTIGIVCTMLAIGAVWAAPTGTTAKDNATAGRR